MLHLLFDAGIGTIEGSRGVAVVRLEARMAENQDRARGPAGPDPQPGWPPPAATSRDSEPAGPLGVPQPGVAGQGTGPARGCRSSLIVWAAVAMGAAAAVAVGVWVGLAEHAAPFNVVLFLLVVAVGGAEPVIRRRGGASAGAAGARAAGPAASAVKPAARISSLVGICAVGGITGIYSLFAALVSDACSSLSRAGSQCDTTIGLAWLVLILTQAVIFILAIVGAASARSYGQLVRGLILGLAGPFLALAAFFVAVSAYG